MYLENDMNLMQSQTLEFLDSMIYKWCKKLTKCLVPLIYHVSASGGEGDERLETISARK